MLCDAFSRWLPLGLGTESAAMGLGPGATKLAVSVPGLGMSVGRLPRFGEGTGPLSVGSKGT